MNRLFSVSLITKTGDGEEFLENWVGDAIDGDQALGKAIKAEKERVILSYDVLEADLGDLWIPAIEESPDDQVSILMVSGNLVVCGVFTDKHGFRDPENEPVYGVTHWMYLPNPPTEEV